MGTFLKRAFFAVAFLLLLFVALPLAAGIGLTAMAYSVGTVHLEVDDGEDTHFSVPLPAGIVPLAMRLMPRSACQDLDPEVEANWPAVRAAVAELSRIPDAVLVEVNGGHDETVQVIKKDGRILVRVRDGDERVNVAVPVHLVSSVVNQFDRVCF